MAAEQWSGNAVPATDQYALAVMTYQLLTGIAPFQGRPEQIMFQHMSVPPEPPSTVNPRLSHAIDAVLLRALAKRPEERFPSVNDFAKAFQQALTKIPDTVVVRPPSLPPQPPIYFADATVLSQAKPLPVPQKSGVPFLFYIAGVLLLIGAIAVGIFTFSRSPSGTNTTTFITHNSLPTATTIPTSTSSFTPTVIPTPTSSFAPTAIPYPSYQDAEAAITYYYQNESDFKGKNVIQHFDSVTYGTQTGPTDQPQFTACAQYEFALVSSPNVTADTARHTFTFQYDSGTWKVIDMGNWNSC